MNLLDLRSRVLTRLGESGTPVSYTPGQVNAALNEGLRSFALITLCVERTAVLRLANDTNAYQLLTLLADFIVALQCRCHVILSGANVSEWDAPLWDAVLWDETVAATGDTLTRVSPARLEDLDAANGSWRLERNTTVKRYVCLGLDLFVVHPCPAAPGTSVEIVYAAFARELSADVDEPEIPPAYHQALVHYALSTLPLKYGGAELENAADDFGQFLGMAKACAEAVQKRAALLGYDRQPYEIRTKEVKHAISG